MDTAAGPGEASWKGRAGWAAGIFAGARGPAPGTHPAAHPREGPSQDWASKPRAPPAVRPRPSQERAGKPRARPPCKPAHTLQKAAHLQPEWFGVFGTQTVEVNEVADQVWQH